MVWAVDVTVEVAVCVLWAVEVTVNVFVKVVCAVFVTVTDWVVLNWFVTVTVVEAVEEVTVLMVPYFKDYAHRVRRAVCAQARSQ